MSTKKRRFTDSSIDVSHYSRVYDESLTSSAEICYYDHPALQEIKEKKAARYRVYMTRLEPKIRVYADAEMRQTVAYSKEVAECMIAESITQRSLMECYLFDAAEVGQLMCLGVGRYPHNLLRPYVGDDIDSYYDDPDTLDPACICGQISRDHGLVFMDSEGTIKYRDFGTKKRETRSGSKNGTWVNGEYRVQNAVFEWKEGDYLGLGGRVWVRREGELVKEHVFKLRYERFEE